MSSTEHPVGPANPADLYRCATAFWQSRMLSVAVELDLFSTLATGGATLAELCDRLGLHPRPAEALLNGLCALGFLTHHGGCYHNGETAQRWLDRAKPDYLGGLFTQANAQYPLWTRLRALLETGEVQSGHPELDGMLEDEAGSLRDFAEAVDAQSAGCGPALAAAVDWTHHRTVVDLGGARGTVLAGILAAHPHLRGVCFDLPAMAPLFAEHTPRLGVADRIRFQAGDFFADELPTADTYLLGHLLPDWDDERCESLVARAAAALRPGGNLLIYDALIDPDHPRTARNWLLTLNMQLATPGGGASTTADCRKWMERAGLTGIHVQPLASASSPAETLVVASKPG